MKIRKDDYHDVFTYVDRMRWEGFEFVAFLNEDIAVDKDTLEFFQDDYEANEYCHESNTDLDLYGFMATRSVVRAMAAGMENPELLVEKFGLIDVAAMVSAHYKRLEQQQNSNNTKEGEAMNEQNYEYLADQVRFTGFGDLGDDLQGMIKKKRKAFELKSSSTFNGDTISAVLKFTKSKESDMYFFNSYDVELAQKGEKDPLKQTFYINNRGSSITLKEAYNLLQGRAVNKGLTNKEGEVYNAWLQMDFKNTDEKGNFRMKRYYDNYGFDLEETLKKYPIKELSSFQYKDALMDSLKKGNRQSATFIKDGVETKRFIEARPQFKTINVYGEDGRLRLQESRAASQDVKQDETAQGQQQNNNTQQSRRQKKTDEGDDGKDSQKQGTRNTRKRRQSVA